MWVLGGMVHGGRQLSLLPADRRQLLQGQAGWGGHPEAHTGLLPIQEHVGAWQGLTPDLWDTGTRSALWADRPSETLQELHQVLHKP